ncbi:polymeric immunoglobulin receptor-like [Pristis pectinata]|uniref:polymeric immunoglobulin receptor-like n=1 Tax=Pristis pectinata TaxID=685728 RepID=UPI00223DE3E2|nr:polymeric immunoglobulin receptor-like [Pristis pectinata]
MISPSVSGALWAEKYVRGVVGRAITIDCHYADWYRSHTKYWCRGWDRQCSVIVETNGQHGRRGRESITDNPARGIFTVTVEDLHSGDTGWYTCGITTPGLDPMFPVHLVVSDEAVSVPVLGFLSPANASRLGGSVSVSCESVQGSLPIQYTWYEKTPPVDSKVSNTSELDLHCQTFKHRHHQYYCTASNNRGANSSEMVNVTVFKTTANCSYGIEINGTLSGGLWAEKYLRGVVGRAITINCHYAATYRSHTKYWCRVCGQLCTELAQTEGQNGQYRRKSITDNPTRGIFTVTMENIVSEDTGWYRCGITTPDKHPMFDIHLQVSDEPVSVPVLGFLSPANVSHCEDSVTVTCESVQGSLPITYAWYEKTPSVVSNISNTSILDLHCQSLKDQHYQYYCTASNVNGTKSSKMVNVSISNNVSDCRNVIEVNNVGSKYFCETFMTESTTTAQGKRPTPSPITTYKIIPSVIGVLLIVLVICLIWYQRHKNRESKSNTSHRGDKNKSQEALEGSVVYADLQRLRKNEAASQLANQDNGIMYAAVQFQKKSRAGHPVTDEDNVTYSEVKVRSKPDRANRKAPSPDTLQDSAQAIYANSAF